MKSFDLFAAIDWSGAEKPLKSDKIALATCDPAGIVRFRKEPLSRLDISDWIASQISGKYGARRVFIGMDCNFGYAASVAKKILGEGCTYLDIWRQIDAICADSPNFFAGKFWQHEHCKDLFWTGGVQPEWFIKDNLTRETERACVDKGLGHPENTFKLLGPKQVGKGGLAAMRMIFHLKQIYGHEIAIWPFEHGEAMNRANIVIAEIFPRLFWRMIGAGNAKQTERIAVARSLKLLGASYDGIMPKINEHQADALISAAGMRHLIHQSGDTHFDVAHMSADAKSKEGWIWGV